MKRLTLPGTLDSLDAIGKYILEAASEAGLDKKATYRLRLAVDEIATNSIVHGYEEAGRTGNIDVWADLDDTSLTVALEDSGPPYDVLKTPHPDSIDLPLDQREIGGLGVYLALKGVDKLRYEYINGRNRNIFVMNRQPQ